MFDIIHFDTYTTGHRCKVNELEYSDLLLEALVANSETEIHRPACTSINLSVLKYMYICHTHRVTCMDTATWYKVCGRMCCCAGLLRNPFGLIINILLIKLDEPYFVYI